MMKNYIEHKIVYLAAFCSLTILAIRACLNLSFSHPYQMLTSGYEEEALFSIWKHINGEAVYADPFSIPFAASYFNWLFYWLYGEVCSLVVKLFGLGDLWIPTIVHLLSLVLISPCVFVAALGFRSLQSGSGIKTASFGLAVGTLAVCNPVMGWWSMTARPDVGALLGELAALYFAITYLKKPAWAWLFSTVLAAFVAWSFRPNAVNVISGLCLYFILYRRWPQLLLSVSSTFALYLLVFKVGGEPYWQNVITSNTATELRLEVGIQNLVSALVKAPVIIGGVFCLYALLRKAFRSALTEPLRLTGLVFSFAIIWASITCMKVGASDNYFIVPVAVSVLLVMVVLKSAKDFGQQAAYVRWGLAVILVVQVFACAAVLCGLKGRMDLRGDQAAMLALKQKLMHVHEPVFVTDRKMNLPWINPTRPCFVYAYAYRMGRFRDHSFQSGGLEGLLETRFFKLVIHPKGQKLSGWPVLSTKYWRHDEDKWFQYYLPVE